MLLDRTRWYLQPVFLFSFSAVSLVLSTFIFIYWYMEITAIVEALIRRLNLDPDQFIGNWGWELVTLMTVLAGIILTGMLLTFLFYQKTLQLYRLQHNFISNFTHELKTPVTSLKIYLETFAKHELNRSERARYTGFMLKDVSRLSDTINSILNLARIESQSYGGQKVVTDLHAFITAFRETNAHLFRKARIHISPPPAPPVRYPIHPVLFDMLLMNLLTNAMIYNDSPQPEIHISLVRGRKRIRLTVADNGRGFPQKEAGNLFKKFYQVAPDAGRSAQGNGIGLYLVQNIARIHNGSISAASEAPSKGSRFTLTLPELPKPELEAG